MNKIIKISIILCYILFAQVYPVVHWHAHDHQGEIELHICTHPPDLLTDKSENDHDHSCSHEHEDTHFNGDWDYTFKQKTPALKIDKQLVIKINILNDVSKVLKRNPQEIESQLAHYHLTILVPDRAPPQLS